MLKNLKLLRTKLGISQKQLADAIGVSQQSINKYENHDVEPDIAIMISLSEFFSVSVDYLIGHTDVERLIEPLEKYDLNKKEKALLDGYRLLNKSEKQIIDFIIQNSKK